MCKSCSNAGFTCFEGSFGAQPGCLHLARKADTPEPALECGGPVQRPGDIEALLQPHFLNISCGFLWGCVSGKRCFHLKSPKVAIYGIFPGAKEYELRGFFFPSSRCLTQGWLLISHFYLSRWLNCWICAVPLDC